MGLLDLLFPKYCIGCKKFGEYICAECFAHISFISYDLCLVCNRQAVDGETHPGCRTSVTIDGAVASLVYAGIVKKLVYAFKYQPNITDLRETLIEFLYEGILEKEKTMRVIAQADFLIPIPLHKAKFRERGYNQATILAEGLSKKFDIPVADALIRQKQTSSQFKLNKEQRKQNMRDAFVFNQKLVQSVKGRTLILIDDVGTTEMTMLEAGKVLKKAGAKKVWGVALAHGR